MNLFDIDQIIINKYAQNIDIAIPFIVDLLDEDNDFEDSISILKKLDNCNIKGYQCFVLYEILGEKSIKKVAEICRNVPDDVLTNACDNSNNGRELIKSYIDNE